MSKNYEELIIYVRDDDSEKFDTFARGLGVNVVSNSIMYVPDSCGGVTFLRAFRICVQNESWDDFLRQMGDLGIWYNKFYL